MPGRCARGGSIRARASAIYVGLALVGGVAKLLAGGAGRVRPDHYCSGASTDPRTDDLGRCSNRTNNSDRERLRNHPRHGVGVIGAYGDREPPIEYNLDPAICAL